MSSQLKRVIAAILVLGACMLVVSACGSAKYAKVGDCLEVTKFGSSPSAEQAPCSDADALYLVASNTKTKTTSTSSSGCPTGEYATYSQKEKKKTVTLCLAQNMTEGRCYTESLNAMDAIKLTDCKQRGVKVVDRVDGKADKSLCTQGTTALVFPQPALTYCLTKVG